MNLAKLNHVFIPSTNVGRDRFRRSAVGRIVGPIGRLYVAMTIEGKLLAVVALFAGFLGLGVGTTQIYMVWCALTGLLVASLVVRLGYGMSGVRVEVNAPKRVIQGQELRFSLVLHNAGERDHHSVTLVGPYLPWDGKWTSRKPVVATLRTDGTARVEMRARFEERGEHHLDPFRAGALVPFGLFLGALVSSPSFRFTVVPKLANVKSVSTPLGRSYQPGGVALASKMGESLELIGVRPYRIGDTVRDLHAKSSARLGVPVVREYVQEYFTRIGVVLDTDRTVSTPEQLEAAISLTAGIIARLSRGEALIDVLVVGDHVRPLTLGRSLGFLDQALDLLACVQPGPELSAERLTASLSPYLERLSSVVIVSLSWDASRARVVERIRSAGVGCRVIVVRANDDARAPADPEATVVMADDVARGEALAL